jgi:hypothetical protein
MKEDFPTVIIRGFQGGLFFPSGRIKVKEASEVSVNETPPRVQAAH